MAGGRPSDYKPEILDKAREYIARFLDSENFPKDEVIPSIEGLAIYLDINRSTLYDWNGQKGKQEFSDIIEKLKALQGKTLLTGTLKNQLNASVGKAILSRHGYSEKTEQEQSIKHSMDEDTKSLIEKALDDV